MTGTHFPSAPVYPFQRNVGPQDKVHTEPNGLAPTYTLGLHLFLVHLLRNPDVAIEQNVLNVSLALIRIERDGEIVNRGLLKTLTDMLCELREVSSDGKQGEGESVYKSWWEEHFLSETRRYYTTEADTNLETLSTPEFLLRVEKRLSEESDRIETYLHPNTCPLLFSLLDNVLIANTAQTVISNPTTGLASLLQDDKIDDLSRMYKLFGRTGDGHILLQRGLKAWMVEQGAKIIDNNASSSAASTTAPSAAGQGDAADTAAADVKGKGKARDDGAAPATTGFATSKAGPSAGSAAAASNLAIEWVTSVLSLKDKMDKIWNEAFEKDRHFQNAINDVSFHSTPRTGMSAARLQLQSGRRTRLTPRCSSFFAGLCHLRQPGQEGTRVHLHLPRREPEEGSEGQERIRGRRGPRQDHHPLPIPDRQGCLRGLLQASPRQTSLLWSLGVGRRREGHAPETQARMRCPIRLETGRYAQGRRVQRGAQCRLQALSRRSQLGCECAGVRVRRRKKARWGG